MTSCDSWATFIRWRTDPVHRRPVRGSLPGRRWGRRLALAALALAALAALAGPAGAQALPRMVAHAGGALEGERYLNSLEALEANYARGFRAFEVDLHWTGDGQLVLIHDWNRTLRRHFGTYDPGWWERLLARLRGRSPRPSLSEWLRMGRRAGITPLDAMGLGQWLRSHRDAVVITDVKADNLYALSELRKGFPGVAAQVVPQIFRFDEYDPVRGMGYQRIVLALYRMDEAEVRRVPDFAAGHDLAAVTLSRRRALETDLAPRLAAAGVFVYAHTINDRSSLPRLAARGVQGVYTDVLPPEPPAALAQKGGTAAGPR